MQRSELKNFLVGTNVTLNSFYFIPEEALGKWVLNVRASRGVEQYLSEKQLLWLHHVVAYGHTASFLAKLRLVELADWLISTLIYYCLYPSIFFPANKTSDEVSKPSGCLL